MFADEWSKVTKDKILEFFNNKTKGFENGEVFLYKKYLIWKDCSVKVDEDLSVDMNLSRLMDRIYEKHPELA